MSEKTVSSLLILGATLILLVGIFTISISTLVLVLALYIVLSLALSAYLARVAYNRLLERYARIVFNIYERSLYPEDDQVYERAQEHRFLLAESGNRLEVKVVEIYFRDYMAPNETWDEFLQRARNIQDEDHAKRVEWLNRLDRDFFKAEVLHQRSVAYQNQRPQ